VIAVLLSTTVRRGRELVRWRYKLDAADGGTDVTESFEVMWLPPVARLFEVIIMANRDRQREAAMRATLDRIKAVAERVPA